MNKEKVKRMARDLASMSTTEALAAAFDPNSNKDPTGAQIYINRVKGVRKLEV